MVSFQILGPLILRAEQLAMEDGAPQQKIDEVLAQIRALGPNDPDVQTALLQLGFTLGESADRSMAECADKTLDVTDRDSWDYNGEDSRPSETASTKSRRLAAFTKRQP